MATSPDRVRAGLTVVTDAARRDLRAVAGSTEANATAIRSSLFAATPLIVSEYADGTAALALDWFEELREAAGVGTAFTPRPVTLIDEDALAQSVAVTTEPLYEIQRGIERDLADAVEESLRLLEAEVQREVASGFWDTMTTNATEDPESVGWRRFARPGACKFCLMLADKGAVYSEASVDFAAHTNCSCVVGPSYDPNAERASVMQYQASSKNRSEKDRARLRDYLNENFPDAPG